MTGDPLDDPAYLDTEPHDAAAYDGDPYDRPAAEPEHDPRVFRSVIEQAQGRVVIGEIERDSPRVTDTEAGTD